MGTVRMSCVRAEIMAFSMPVRMPGTGRPIMEPMATYIRGISRTMEATRRTFMLCCSSWALLWRTSHSLRKPPPFASGTASAGEAP